MRTVTRWLEPLGILHLSTVERRCQAMGIPCIYVKDINSREVALKQLAQNGTPLVDWRWYISQFFRDNQSPKKLYYPPKTPHFQTKLSTICHYKTIS